VGVCVCVVVAMHNKDVCVWGRGADDEKRAVSRW